VGNSLKNMIIENPKNSKIKCLFEINCISPTYDNLKKDTRYFIDKSRYYLIVVIFVDSIQVILFISMY